MSEAHVHNEGGKFTQLIEIREHRLFADQLIEAGGNNKGIEPHEFLLAALGSCTSMTVKMYADNKAWPLEKIEVSCSLSKEETNHVFKRSIKLTGALDEEQRKRLIEIANKCPVHKTLTGSIRIDTIVLT